MFKRPTVSVITYIFSLNILNLIPNNYTTDATDRWTNKFITYTFLTHAFLYAILIIV
jgi:hypothetical protein